LGQGLTGWVWQNKRPLRLENIERDRDELEWKYHGLRWTQTVNDSAHHREWLGVPLFGRHGEVIGVIRVPEKKRTGKTGGGGFTFKDEILLMSLGQYVADQIQELQSRERGESAMRICLECAVELARVTNPAAVAATVLRACARAWGTDGKAHLFNVLGHNRSSLRIAAVQGRLARRSLIDTEVPLAASLSGVSLGRHRAVILHDLEAARRRSQ
jgi:hypothetical protein